MSSGDLARTPVLATPTDSARSCTRNRLVMQISTSVPIWEAPGTRSTASRRWSVLQVWRGQSSAVSALMAQVAVYDVVHHTCPRGGVGCMRSRSPPEGREPTWLILPVVICLSQRLSHACLSISFYMAKLRMAHYNSYSLFDGHLLLGYPW